MRKHVQTTLAKLADEIEEAATECKLVDQSLDCPTCEFQLKCAKAMRLAIKELNHTRKEPSRAR